MNSKRKHKKIKQTNNTEPLAIIRKIDAKRVHQWASKFIRTIERAHKRAAKSKLHFDNKISVR